MVMPSNKVIQGKYPPICITDEKGLKKQSKRYNIVTWGGILGTINTRFDMSQIFKNSSFYVLSVFLDFGSQDTRVPKLLLYILFKIVT